jgi:Asp-tRNA(Asn)/Glu-tRNA(Gln) amidotransferase A subunit family amidase
MTDLTRLTISECSVLLAQRQISAVELTSAYLERIQKIDHPVELFYYPNRRCGA